MVRFFKRLFVIIIILIFLVAFSKSYTSSNINNLAVVVALGLDVSSTNKLSVTFQFTNASSVSDTGSSEKISPKLFSIEASSISNAINLMNTNIGKEVNLSHCKLIVFSENLASKGISEEIYTLSNNPQIRPSTNIVVSKESAKSYLENTEPTLENLITKYYEVFVNSSQFTGYNSNATIGDFFYSMTCDACEPYAILGEITTKNSTSNPTDDTLKKSNISVSNFSPQNNQAISSNIGLAVFREDVLVGELDAIENLCFMIIDNKVDGFLVSVPDPQKNNSYIDIYITPTIDTKVKTDLVNNSPFISINCKFSGRIYSIDQNSSYSDSTTLEQISNSCNNYLESIILDYLYKTSKELNSDINKFGKYFRKNFLTESEFKNYNWKNKYKDSFFEVSVDSSIKSSFLLTQT